MAKKSEHAQDADKMRMLDLFSGIGGFHKGFEQAGYEFDWVGFSEIDKYASAVYRHRFPKAEELGDITTIQPGDLPKIDLITFGSPCQDFSIAGKRAGAKEGTRSSLIWQAIRLITECKPRFFVWENVKGTFSSNSGADFWAIIQAFTNIGGYRLEWQLISTRWFLPQNRERIYLVGYIGDRSGQSVFPIGETDEVYNRKQTQNHSQISNCIDSNYHKGWLDDGQRTMIAELNQIGTIGKDSEATRVYDPDGIARTLTDGGGMGAKTGLYKVGELKITAKKRSYDTPKEINEYLKANKNGKTIKQIAESIDLPKTQVEHYFRSDKCRAIPSPEHWILLKELLGFDDTYDKQVTDIYEKEVEFESSRRVYSVDGISKTIDTNETGYYAAPVLTPNRAEKRQNGRRFKEDGEDMFTLTGQDQHGVMFERSQIRRLTPVECCRLQGFPDDWNEYGEFDGEVKPMSDTQRYKQCGNAVTVNVVQAVAERIASPKVQNTSTKKDV